MIQALNMQYSSKTDEIMSRYRPIAPKPESSSSQNNNTSNAAANDDGSLVPEKFRQSPYLRNIWSHLQARPTRTRKRGGRTPGISQAAVMIRKQQQQEHAQQNFMATLCSPTHFTSHAATNLNLSFQGFGIYGGDQHQHAHAHAHAHAHGDIICKSNNNIVELPLLSCPTLLSVEEENLKAKAIDLNTITETSSSSVLEEKDLLLQLQVASPTNNKKSVIISPRPVRPVGSSISIVGPLNKDLEVAQPIRKSAEEVEEEVELEALPSVITDSNMKVRMVNSSYKELVGQPECPWLDSMVRCSSSSSSKKISGEVLLNLTLPLPNNNGFTCWVRIEWESQKKTKKNVVNAFCDAVRLVCQTKDYLFHWRFHTPEVQVSPSSASN